MRSLRFKLIIAFLLTSLAAIVLVAIFVQQFVIREFDSYVLEQHRDDFQATVAEYYTEYGSWNGIRPYMGEVSGDRVQPPGGPPRPGVSAPNQPPPDNVPARFILTDANGYVVLPFDGYEIGQRVPRELEQSGESVEVDGEIVGLIITTDNSLRRDPAEEAYLERTNWALLAATVGGVSFALLLGIGAARLYLRPLRELTAAANEMAKGNLQQQVPVRTKDELGLLAAQFNQMSEDLAHANQLRQQMTADIAHDLRTPLTVVAGYIEALRDGVLQATPERFEMIYSETILLQHLVEDLRTLSLADAGELKLNRRSTPPRQILERTAETYQLHATQQDIVLRVDTSPQLPLIDVDEDQLLRVLGNLVSNALRYTPVGGEIVLAAQANNGDVKLIVRDNGTGIHPDQLPNIFERFYRGDEARNHEYGESGLGLAIARSIVAAHGGSIAVESALDVGTTFTITLATRR